MNARSSRAGPSLPGSACSGSRRGPTELAARQACAAIGQSRLMERYSREFGRHGLHVAQLLLTHGDLDSRLRHANARTTLEHLFARRGVVPIINENDSVAVEELRFGDNDRLSAEVAMLAGADRLILLTSVDGLLDAQGRTVPQVTDITEASKLAREEKGRFSVGGMTSKLQAVKLAVDAGISTYVVSGRIPVASSTRRPASASAPPFPLAADRTGATIRPGFGRRACPLSVWQGDSLARVLPARRCPRGCRLAGSPRLPKARGC